MARTRRKPKPFEAFPDMIERNFTREAHLEARMNLQCPYHHDRKHQVKDAGTAWNNGFEVILGQDEQHCRNRAERKGWFFLEDNRVVCGHHMRIMKDAKK